MKTRARDAVALSADACAGLKQRLVPQARLEV